MQTECMQLYLKHTFKQTLYRHVEIQHRMGEADTQCGSGNLNIMCSTTASVGSLFSTFAVFDMNELLIKSQ